MDDKVLSIVIGAILGGLFGVGIGLIASHFTDASVWTVAGAFIGAALGGSIGWCWESRHY